MAKIVITGSSGFIGRHLVKFYNSPKNEIIALTEEICDIREIDKVSLKGADIIIHLASTVHNYNIFSEPTLDIDVNCIGTIQLLETTKRDCPDAKMVYFVGCTTSYREKNVAIATAEILNSLQIEFKILKDESCCGSPVYMTGQVDKAKKIAEKNVKMLKDAGIEKIITSCAGCYRTLKDTYPNKFGFDLGIEIIHMPKFLLNMLNSGELKFNKEVNMKITYHDPCHIGRHMGIYEPPRKVLNKITGIELVEMPRNRNNAWCCGSGGGVRSAFKDLSAFAANERIEEAKGTSAEAIVSCCPFCLNQFKTHIKDNEIKALDIAELARKAI